MIATATARQLQKIKTLLRYDPPYVWRGANRQFIESRAHEVMLSGPAETGKTWAACFKLHMACREYPGAQCALVRKVAASIYPTVFITLKKIIGEFPVTYFGGEKTPTQIIYPNGSTIYIGGIDNPNKVLSGERDIVYSCQSEELELDDWEKMLTRTTGRGAIMPHTQSIGDCNPGPQTHWILGRPQLKVFYSRHEDNPSLYDDSGNLTEQGRRTMSILDSLTGVRKERLRYGRWVSAEGTVYEFNPAIHEIDPFPIPKDWRKIRGVDFGYVNPFTCGWWAIDPDGRMYLYREIYMTKRTVRVHAQQINELSQGEDYEATIVDHDAEDRATLEENGIYTTAADKDILSGIDILRERMKVQGDGKPRFFVMRGALVEKDRDLVAAHKPTCLRDELDVYSYARDNGKALKDVPVKMFDHACDPARYVSKYLDTGWIVYGL